MTFAKFAGHALVAVLGLAFFDTSLKSTAAEEPYKAQIDALRKSLEKYQDYKVAVRDLYLSTVGACIIPARNLLGTWNIPKARWGCTLLMSRCAVVPIR